MALIIWAKYSTKCLKNVVFRYNGPSHELLDPGKSAGEPSEDAVRPQAADPAVETAHCRHVRPGRERPVPGADLDGLKPAHQGQDHRGSQPPPVLRGSGCRTAVDAQHRPDRKAHFSRGFLSHEGQEPSRDLRSVERTFRWKGPREHGRPPQLAGSGAQDG